MALRSVFTLIGTGGITGIYLASGAVTSAKIADDAIDADKIADGAVGSAALASGSVTEAKIASGAVSAGKLADGASSLFYASVKVVTDIDVTLDGAPDAPYGVSLGVNDLVLVMGQTDDTENGIYAVDVVGTGDDGEWSRPTSRDQAAELPAGMLVFDQNTHQLYKLTTAPAVVGDDPVIFEVHEEGLSATNSGEPEAVGVGDGSTLNFDLLVAKPVFVAVIVDGLVQAPGTYSVAGTAGAGGVAQLQFGSGNAPANGAVIEAIVLHRS